MILIQHIVGRILISIIRSPATRVWRVTLYVTRPTCCRVVRHRHPSADAALVKAEAAVVKAKAALVKAEAAVVKAESALVKAASPSFPPRPPALPDASRCVADQALVHCFLNSWQLRLARR